MKPYTILGLDVSTACIGITFAVVENGKVTPVEVKHLLLKVPKKKVLEDGTKVPIEKKEELFLKCDLFIESIKDIASKYKIDHIVIEEPLISSNNRNTVAVLLRFNGMVSLSCYQQFGVPCEYISSYDARKWGMPSVNAVRSYNKKGETLPLNTVLKGIAKSSTVPFGSYPFDICKKDIVWDYISERYPDIRWVYNKNNELAKENYDATDSLMCVLGYNNKLLYGDTEPTIVGASNDGKGHVSYTVSFCGEECGHSFCEDHVIVENGNTNTEEGSIKDSE